MPWPFGFLERLSRGSLEFQKTFMYDHSFSCVGLDAYSVCACLYFHKYVNIYNKCFGNS